MVNARNMIFKLLYLTGVIHLKRRYRPRRTLTILGYHQIHTPGFLQELMGWKMTPEKFRLQMEYIARHYRVIDSKELEGAMRGHWPLPENALAITFDDGYRDVYDVALPVLKKLGLQAVVFLTTGALDDSRSIWTNVLYYYFYLTRKSQYHMTFPDGTSIGGRWTNAQEKRECILRLNRQMKSILDRDRPKAMSVLATSLEVGHGEDPLPDLPMMSWEHVRSLRDSGVFTIGAHTVSHPILSRCEPDVQKSEMETSKRRIEAETGIPCRFFAYPNGQYTDFTEETRALAQETGFSLAFRFSQALPGESIHPMAVPRKPVMTADLAEFAWAVS